MDKWEYLTYSMELKTLDTDLARLGQEGWELAGFVTDNSVAYCVLKRRVDSQPVNITVNNTVSREEVLEWVRESLKREAWR